MRVLFCSSEIAPLAKTGGLADVAGALPKALARRGVEVRLAMPAYRGVRLPEAHPAGRVSVSLGGERVEGTIVEGRMPDSGLPVWLVEQPGFFDRAGLYGEGGADYPDNLARFTFFCRAVQQWVDRGGWVPEVVHCNDWQTALLPVLLKTEGPGGVATVLTIHNLAYQGVFPADQFRLTGLPASVFTIRGLEFWGKVNLLKGGLYAADILSTVSETYAREIQSDEYGMGLQGLLRVRSADLFGILNGVDYSQWDPAVDAYLPARYSADDLSGKARCKAALQAELGLPGRADTPLLGTVARLVPQKGFDLVTEALEGIVDAGAQLVVLGTGEQAFEAAFRAAAERWPSQVRAVIGFDEALAHRIEGGADIFLMPSRFEPSGLNQLYSLRYGTVPVVRKTGGLADSIVDVTAETLQQGTANGFVFEAYTAQALLATVQRAIAAYRDPPLWRRIQQIGMRADFSWDRAAERYRALYGLTVERASRWR